MGCNRANTFGMTLGIAVWTFQGANMRDDFIGALSSGHIAGLTDILTL
jgi:hypothetical protein